MSWGLGGDGLKAAGKVGEDVAVPQAEDAEALLGKPLVALGVAGGAVAGPVGFDDEAVVSTIKVGNEGADGDLATDFQAHEATVSKSIPEGAFGRSHVFAHSPGAGLGQVTLLH